MPICGVGRTDKAQRQLPPLAAHDTGNTRQGECLAKRNQKKERKKYPLAASAVTERRSQKQLNADA